MPGDSLPFRNVFIEHLEMGKPRDQAAWDAKAEYDNRTPPEDRHYWIDSEIPLPWQN